MRSSRRRAPWRSRSRSAARPGAGPGGPGPVAAAAVPSGACRSSSGGSERSGRHGRYGRTVRSEGSEGSVRSGCSVGDHRRPGVGDHPHQCWLPSGHASAEASVTEETQLQDGRVRGAHWRVAAAVVVTAALSACVNGPGGCDFDPCPPGKGSVAALDAEGAERWRTSISDRSDDPPTVSGNNVIVDGCRAVHVLDAATGRLLVSTEELADGVGVAGGLVWGADAAEDSEPARGVRGVPLEREGGTGGNGGRTIEHLGGSNGESGDFARTFTVSGDDLVGTHGDVLSVDPAAGGPGRWVQLPARPTQRVLVLGDRAVTASPDGSGVGVDTAAMRLAWRVVPDAVSRSYALRLKAVGDTVVVTALAQSAADEVSEVFAVSAGDGRVLWRRRGWELAVVEGAVAVLMSPTTVAGVELATGRELWARRAGPGYVDSYPDAQLVTRAGAQAVAAGVVALPARHVRGQQH